METTASRILRSLYLVASLSVLACGQAEVEEELKRHLFPATFDPSVRPVEHYLDNVTVGIGMAISQIVDMNEQLQTLQSEIWIRLVWRDPRLVWEPADFGNISIIHVMPGRAWTPDIVVFNNVGFATGRDPNDFLLEVQSTGAVGWFYPQTMLTSCKMDMTYFPYDRQECHYQFGSWTLDGDMLDVRYETNRNDSTWYVDNGEWKMNGVTVRRREVYYDCCPHPYPTVTFTVSLQRRCLYYVFNLMVPCILITLLHLTAFLLPAESGEKISLNVTILLGLTVFQLLVAALMPPQSEVLPVIIQYFGICIFLVALSTAMAVFVLHLHFRGTRGFPVPPMLRSVIIGKLGYILFYGKLVNATAEKFQQKREKEEAERRNVFDQGKMEVLSVLTMPVTANGAAPPGEEKRPKTRRRTYIHRDGQFVPKDEPKPSIEDLGLLHRHLDDKSEEEKAVVQDWILVSLILDRLFLILMAIGDMAAIIFVITPMVNGHQCA